MVGDDEVGRRLVACARADGIDVDPVIHRAGATTGLIVDVVDAAAHWRYLEDLPEATLLTGERPADPAAGLLRDEPYERVARQAVAAAGATVGRPGGRPELTATAVAEQLDRIPSR
ncbi:hypothetical protein [Micromonospora cathayae]|uniref:Uncharacterized protein n=1 Tax=Micromonospora cathayae TaxID=3028804 RepID=A0ABY7ZM56_9ACTN|nr:hypothetical protein [Micromonospora sp. HUAS 3]WDZ83054.1 hypothetical protein PVK37_21620 [Micromonospora sp. HUAS 3]